MNYVYMLLCSDNTLYTGWTNNLEKRIHAHRTQKGAKYTKYRSPLKLVHVEEFVDKGDALRREAEIKTFSRRQKDELIKSTSVEKYAHINNNETRRISYMKDLKFYICKHCHNVIVKTSDSGVPVMCCGEEMEELIPNTVDAAQEKHVPVVTRENGRIFVEVGSVTHPMEEKHYIEFIVLETQQGFRIKYLKPGDTPKVDFYDDEPVIAVYEYCNLHGLWKTEA